MNIKLNECQSENHIPIYGEMDSKNAETKNRNTYPILFYEIHLVLDDQFDESLFQKNVQYIAYQFRLSQSIYVESISTIISNFERMKYLSISRKIGTLIILFS